MERATTSVAQVHPIQHPTGLVTCAVGSEMKGFPSDVTALIVAKKQQEKEAEMEARMAKRNLSHQQ